MSKARSWSNTPPCAGDGRKDMAVVFAMGVGVWGCVQGELTSSWLICNQENQPRSLPFAIPLISYRGGDVLIFDQNNH